MTTATMEKKIKNLESKIDNLTKFVMRDFLPYDENISPSLLKKIRKLKKQKPVFEYTGPGSLMKFLKEYKGK